MNPEEISHDSSLVKMDTDYQMEESVSDRVKRLKEAERQAKAKQEVNCS